MKEALSSLIKKRPRAPHGVYNELFEKAAKRGRLETESTESIQKREVASRVITEDEADEDGIMDEYGKAFEEFWEGVRAIFESLKAILSRFSASGDAS